MSRTLVISDQLYESLTRAASMEGLATVEDLLGRISISLAARAPQECAVRRPGSAEGLIRMADDFDEPLDDFRDYM